MFGVSTIGAESAFDFGLDYYDENLGIDVDYAIRINTSGPIKGMYVNFAQKFHSNVIRAVWDADYSEIVVHPVSYMSFTVTLN
jgi:hypothetical protein